MKSEQKTVATINDYIKPYPKAKRELLENVRATIRKAAPTATEKISYQIPTFVLNGNLIHFAAFTHHIGLYPGAAAIEHFKRELTSYETSKGAIRFPLDQPLPLALITKIVRFRVKKNLEAAKVKSKKAL